VILVLLFLSSNYLGRAYGSLLWPVVGFVVAPFTTLAYAYGMNSNNHHISGVYLVIVVAAVLCDLGSWGGGSRSKYRTRKDLS